MKKDRCKQCGRTLHNGEIHRVAHWVFCLPCLEHYIAQGEDDKAVNDVPVTTCAICEQRLEQQNGARLLGGLVCRTCYDHLILQPKPMTAPKKKPLQSRSIPQVYVATGQSTVCSGCGRSIPLEGAKVKEAESYCPECYYAAL